MSAFVTWRRQIDWEQSAFWRNPAAAVFTFTFPLIFLVVFIALYGDQRPDIPGGSVNYAQFYVPSILSFGLISACYTNLAFTLCIRRENGLLKRTRGTPLRPSLYLAGVIGNVVIIALILCGLVLTLGLTVYGVTFPGRYLAFISAIVVGAFCFSAIGIAVSTIVPNEDAAPAIINFLLFPLLFISGTFGPVKDGSALDRIASVFPVRHLNSAFLDTFNPYGTGNGVSGVHLGVMAAWGVLALAVSLRRFRWEPRR